MTDRTCVVDGCERRHSCKGLCSMHYKRWIGTGTTAPRPKSDPICKVPDCGRVATGRQMCNMHYLRFVRSGTTDAPEKPQQGGRKFQGNQFCTVESCEFMARGSGLCGAHRTLLRRTGDTVITKAPHGSVCLVDYCSKIGETRGLCPTHYQMWRTTGDAAGAYGNCLSCGAKYKKYQKTLSCGDEACRKAVRRMYQRRVEARRRQREESQTVETFDPYEIYERDMWRCGLCGDAIDKQLRYPHPYSVSLDHIIPLARLGDHSRGNTQAAHLTCNVRKGARVA